MFIRWCCLHLTYVLWSSHEWKACLRPGNPPCPCWDEVLLPCGPTLKGTGWKCAGIAGPPGLWDLVFFFCFCDSADSEGEELISEDVLHRGRCGVFFYWFNGFFFLEILNWKYPFQFKRKCITTPQIQCEHCKHHNVRRKTLQGKPFNSPQRFSALEFISLRSTYQILGQIQHFLFHLSIENPFI